MFTNPLPDDELYLIHVAPYAQRHFIKRFEKDYPGKVWSVTLTSICEDLKRVRALCPTDQVDELHHEGACWLFKYDFAIALSHRSPKGSGNRCLVFLDGETHQLHILLVYRKGDLPKDRGETQYLEQVLQREYRELLGRFQEEV
ncbi:MAG: hypothetical protein FWF45_07115 [Coriobacteriia bacterium]|nr:hypothetical protein [Coriobacteriia bacterium]